MDDTSFDEQTAHEWIGIIEHPNASVREIDLYPCLRNWLIDSAADSVLDIGCGQGVCSTQVDSLKTSYTGVEPSLHMVNRAVELYSERAKSFILGNVYDLPFPAGSFAAAFSIAVWHLLSNIEKASSELSRVLKPKGRFFIITADPAQYDVWTGRYSERHLNGSVFTGCNVVDGVKSTDTLHLHTMDQLVDSLNRNALKISQAWTIRSFIVISGSKLS